jgi:hypothetical protein
MEGLNIKLNDLEGKELHQVKISNGRRGRILENVGLW